MAFSFTELLKKQFPLAGVEAYTGSPKRMPESNPFPSTSAFGALGMGGLVDALGGVSMADYFNNDNWETRQVEGVSKRGEMVDRQYRMRPGDKTTTEIDKNGNEVVTEKRVSPLNTSVKSFPLGEGEMGDPTAIFRNEQVGMMPIDSIPPLRSTYNRPNEYDRMSRGNHGMGGPLSSIAPNNPIGDYNFRPESQGGVSYRPSPVDASGMPFTEYDTMAKASIGNFDRVAQPGTASNVGADRMGQTNYVYPNNSNAYNTSNISNSGRSMPNRSGYPVDPTLRRNYGVPKYGQARPTSAQTFPIINSLLVPELDDTAQSEMNRFPMLINQGENDVFLPLGPNAYGLDEGILNEDPDDERRHLLGELLRQYYQENPRTYTSSI